MALPPKKIYVVMLDGDWVDLQILADNFRSKTINVDFLPSDPTKTFSGNEPFEPFADSEPPGTYILCSNRFVLSERKRDRIVKGRTIDRLDHSKELNEFNHTHIEKVSILADELLVSINGIIKIYYPNYSSVEIGGICQTTENFSSLWPVNHVFYSSFRANRRTKKSELRSIPKQTRIGLKDKNVRFALDLFGKVSQGWYLYYMIYEIIRDDVGNNQELLKASWTTKKPLNSFTHNAHYARGPTGRHAEKRGPPPENLMSQEQGREYISDLLLKWLKSK